MSDGSEVVYSYVADSSGVMDAIDEVSTGIQSLIEDINGLVEASSALGEFTGIFEEIAAIFGGVDEAAMEATSGIASMAEEAGVAADALGALGADGEAFTEVGMAADEASAQIAGLTEMIDTLGGQVAEDTALIDSLNETIANLEAQIAALTGEFDTATASADGFSVSVKGFKEAQGPLMMLGMAGIAAGKSMFDMGTKAEDALNQVQALAGVGSAQMAQYTSQLEAQSQQFGESLDQEAQGLFFVTSAGFSGAGAMKVLAQSVMDAKAGNIDLATSAKGITAALNAYGASADQASHYNDIMVTAVTNGTQTFQDFASSIGKAATVGNAAHISFNQVAAAESALTDHAFTAKNASNDLSSMMRAMDANIDQTATTAGKLGLSFNESAFKSMDLFHQMQYLQDITKGNQTELGKLVGGQTGLLAFNALMTKGSDGTYKFSQILDTMQHSTGAAAQAFTTSQDTISAHMAKLNATLSVISYKALQDLTPVINAVADAFGKAADFMSQHMDIVMPILAAFAVLIGGVVVAALWMMLAPLFAITVTVGTLSAPFLAVAAVIAVVVAGIVYAVEHWGGIVGWLKGVWSGIADWFNGLLGGIKEKWGQLESFFKGLWGNVVSGTKTAWRNVVDATHQAGANIQSWWKGLSTSFANSPIGSSIIKTLKDQFSQVGQQFGQIGQQLRTQLGSAFSGVGAALGNLGNSFQQIWQQQLVPIGQAIGGAFMTAWKALQEAFAAVGKAIASIPWGALLGAIGQIGSMIGGAFMGAWKALAPILAQIGNFIGGVLLKGLEILGALIGGILLTALSGLLGFIVGLAKAFATFIQGLSMFIGGIVQFFSGIVQVISGVIAFIVDLFTGHFNKLGADLGVIWQGILTMLGGIWEAIKGVFTAGIGAVVSFIWGFITTIIQFFTNLWDSLVGHSIIPDIVNGIVNWFKSMPGKVMGFVSGLVADITNGFMGLVNSAEHWATDMINNFVNGIKNGISAVGNAVSSVANKIASFLKHSKPEMGPLADDDVWGKHFVENFTKGIDESMDKVKGSALNIATSISAAAPNPSNLPQGPSAANSASSAQIAQILQQFLQQQQSRQQVPQPTSANLGAVTQHFSGGINFSGVPQDINALFQMLNQLSGLQFEYGQRGATFNY